MTRTSHNPPRQVGLFITHIQSPLFLIDSIGIVRFSGKEPPRCVIRLLLSQDCPPFTEIFKMMAVIQSRALPSTRMELEKIEWHVPSNLLVKLGIPGPWCNRLCRSGSNKALGCGHSPLQCWKSARDSIKRPYRRSSLRLSWRIFLTLFFSSFLLSDISGWSPCFFSFI